MNPFKIITDSCSDLDQTTIDALDIVVLPLSFEMEGKNYINYPDHRQMRIKDFYQKLRSGVSVRTAQLTEYFIETQAEPYLKDGYDILFISFSSALSATASSFQLAAKSLLEKYPNHKIYVVDSLCASSGEGLFVYYAAMLQQKHKRMEEVYEWLEENKMNLCHLFTVEDLYHLKRGGRLSAPAALFGSLLKIKPILHVSKEGKLVPIMKSRGRKSSLMKMVEHLVETIEHPEDQVVFISHGDCLEDAQTVKTMIQELLPVQEVRLFDVGPVIGAHSGAGTVAVFYLGNEKK